MIDASTDFYKHVDNFAKFAHVGWRLISGDEGLLSKVFVTISIPTYNRPDTLKDAIDSALNQEGYDDYCVMVVDNDPADGTETEELIKSYISDKLLYYKNDENTGMFGNQNRCFEIPKSEFVLLLHDDDILLPNYLNTCVPLLRNKRIDCLQPKKIKWFEDRCNFGELIIPHVRRAKLRRILDIENYVSFWPGTPSGGLFRRDAMKAVGGYNSDYYPTSDYCTAIQLMSTFRFYMYSDVLAVYRVGKNASMKQETLELFTVNDFYLKRQILKRCHVSDLVSNVLLNYKSHAQVAGLRETYNQNLTFDFSKLNMNSSCPRFIYIPFKLYVSIKVFILKLIR